MNYAKDIAIVLRRTNYGEKDRVIVVLGRHHGKMPLIAKGSRSAKSRLAGGIELFCEADISYVRGKNDLATLTGARLKKPYGNIVNDIEKTMLAYETLKLIDRIVEDGHGQEYFDILAGSFGALNDPHMPLDLAKAWFYTRVLKESGRLPRLNNDASGQKLGPSASYTYDFEKHAFSGRPGGRYKADDIKLVRLLAATLSVPNVKAGTNTIKQTAQLVEQLVQQEVY